MSALTLWMACCSAILQSFHPVIIVPKHIIWNCAHLTRIKRVRLDILHIVLCISTHAYYTIAGSTQLHTMRVVLAFLLYMFCFCTMGESFSRPHKCPALIEWKSNNSAEFFYCCIFLFTVRTFVALVNFFMRVFSAYFWMVQGIKKNKSKYFRILKHFDLFRCCTNFKSWMKMKIKMSKKECTHLTNSYRNGGLANAGKSARYSFLKEFRGFSRAAKPFSSLCDIFIILHWIVGYSLALTVTLHVTQYRRCDSFE